LILLRAQSFIPPPALFWLDSYGHSAETILFFFIPLRSGGIKKMMNDKKMIEVLDRLVEFGDWIEKEASLVNVGDFEDGDEID